MCTTAGLRYCGKFASRNLHIHILYAIYCLLHSPLANFAAHPLLPGLDSTYLVLGGHSVRQDDQRETSPEFG